MSFNAEKPNTEAELQYNDSFADFPTFEQMRQQQDQRPIAELFDGSPVTDNQANARKEEPKRPVKEMFVNYFGDDYVAPDEHQESDSAEDGEKRIVGRYVLREGQRAIIYKLEMSDGGEGTEIDSDYQDICDAFKQQHEEIKQNFDLNLAMSGLANDLAYIDVTHGECFNDAETQQRINLLRNYRKLREILESANTPPLEKQLISEYFSQQQGQAFDLLKSHAEQEKGIKDPSELAEAQIKDLEQTLEEDYKKYEESKEDCETQYHLLQRIIEEKYYEDLPTAINKYRLVVDEAIDKAKKWKEDNKIFGNVLGQSKPLLDPQSFDKRNQLFESNLETINQTLKALDNANQYADNLSRQVDALLSA